jgi:hypothetical protein
MTDQPPSGEALERSCEARSHRTAASLWRRMNIAILVASPRTRAPHAGIGTSQRFETRSG